MRWCCGGLRQKVIAISAPQRNDERTFMQSHLKGLVLPGISCHGNGSRSPSPLHRLKKSKTKQNKTKQKKNKNKNKDYFDQNILFSPQMSVTQFVQKAYILQIKDKNFKF